MSQEQNRPPAGSLDHAIKPMLFIAGGFLTMSIIGVGVESHDSGSDSANSQITASGNDQTAITPSMSQAEKPKAETNTDISDYFVPSSVLAAEGWLAVYVIRRRNASKHPFNQPFVQPDEEWYPFNREENKAFHDIKTRLEAET
jgi:hypothetical protein